MIEMRLTLLARRQVHCQLAAEHAQAVGVLESALSAARIRELYIGVVVLLERTFDDLTVSAEQVLYLTLRASERKIGHVQLGWNNSHRAATAATLLMTRRRRLLLLLRRCCGGRSVEVTGGGVIDGRVRI